MIIRLVIMYIVMNEKKNKLSAHDSMAHEWNLEKSSLHQFLRQDLLISLKKYLISIGIPYGLCIL